MLKLMNSQLKKLIILNLERRVKNATGKNFKRRTGEGWKTD